MNELKLKATKKLPKALSKGEEMFALHCQANNLSPEREYVFAVGRMWRFDFAFPDDMIAVEIEGGTWNGGRHTRGSGFAKDCEKYAEAVIRKWLVMRFTTEMVQRGEAIDFTLRALEGKER
jgi:very-short-patch-repair endonuclease